MATNARETGWLTEAVAAEIRALLGYRKMKQIDLSRATGIHKATLSAMLRAQAAIDIEQLAAMADALDVDPGEIMRKARAHQPPANEQPAETEPVASLAKAGGDKWQAGPPDEEDLRISEADDDAS
ncbi:helix-turn-helix domain-containing protein [Nocardia brasiliensis]|uniref:helix-turn-helix domain-containing protein n=1 Tax=Nocardia brasiliensis TaxID=37326 RepID=UPI0037B45113